MRYTSNVVDSQSEKLNRTPNTPAKCICINSGKTEERVLHYLISLLHSYVIYIFKNNCVYAVCIDRVLQILNSISRCLVSLGQCPFGSIWKMNGLCRQTSDIPYVVVYGLHTSHYLSTLLYSSTLTSTAKWFLHGSCILFQVRRYSHVQNERKFYYYHYYYYTNTGAVSPYKTKSRNCVGRALE